ncbi:MAG: hypothetical protein AB1429_11725 [Pseudomonadota bacterium]
MTVSFDPTALMSYYSAKYGAGSSNASATTKAKNPTAPWAPKTTASASHTNTHAVSSTDPATAALHGGAFIDPSSAKLDVLTKDSAANTNYKDLFALYRGLVTLQNLATQAQKANLPASQLSQIQTTFARGVHEVQSFLSGRPFNGIDITATAAEVNANASVKEQTETDSYTTGALVSGSKSAALSHLPADLKFNLTVTKSNGNQVQVAFDLSTIANQPPSLNDVVNYLNTKLVGASLNTRFSTVQIAATPQTIGSGSSKITLSQGKVGYALKLVGVPSEKLNFSADSATSPAVYVAQAAGASGFNPLTGQSANGVQQLVKLNADPSIHAAGGSDVVRTTSLGSNISGAVATATGPDGSVYVVSTQSGKTADGQVLKGANDLVLTKYDSTGQAVFTQALGAANSAKGVTVAVSPDGKTVAVAGTVSGALDANDRPAPPASQTDTVVSSFSTANGAENWTTRTASVGGDAPTAITFGADGKVYVAGTAQKALPGNKQTGTQEGFLQAFNTSGAVLWTQEFGGSGFTTPAGIAVNGSTLYVASNENGQGVVRSYALNGSTAPTLSASRQLGALGGGNIAGVAVNTDGSVIVAGSTSKTTLNVGQIGAPAIGGSNAFVAKLAASLTPDSTELLNYFGNGAATSATSLTVSGGKAYIAGQIVGAATSLTGGLKSTQGFAAQIDPATGALGWSELLPGAGGQDAPSSIAVAQHGASVLDSLGLPTGTINYTPDTKLVDESALRAGDQFTISAGPANTATITIAATDTLTTLAQKINQASGFQANAKVTFSNGVNELQISTNQPSNQISIGAGPAGANALPALGLSEGVITQNALSTKVVSKTNSVKSSPYALGLPSTLNLSSAADIKTAQTDIAAAIKVVQQAYSDLTTPPKKTTSSHATASAKSLAAINSHTSNYLSALARLSTLTGVSSPLLASSSALSSAAPSSSSSSTSAKKKTA